MKHFEHLWEEAESVVDLKYINQKNENIQNTPLFDINYNANILLSYIKNQDDTSELSDQKAEELLGKVIFAVCYISKYLNINAYAALRNTIDDIKVMELEDE